MTHSDSGVSIPQWRLAPDAWRWVRRFDERYARSVLRLRTARVLPAAARARFLGMGIPADVLDSTLGSIKAPDQWANAWIETAQRFLGDYRRQTAARHLADAAQARRLAALSYHIAQLFALDDPRTVRTCRAAAASLYAQSLPFVSPKARRLAFPWRNHTLHGYFQPPADMRGRFGLVVLINGESTSKEELFGWSEAFLRAGLAVFAIDSPGIGEASIIPVDPGDDEDLLDGVFEVMKAFPPIDLEQVSVVGISLGGNLAVRCAAYDRRIMSVVAVTPPFEPLRWLHRANPLLVRQWLTVDRSGARAADDALAPYNLYDVVPGLRSPLLVFGAGRDLVVPPPESQLLASRAGALGSLLWRAGSGHCLYDDIAAWTAEAATWISAVAAARTMEYQATGRIDPVHIAELAREELATVGAIDDDFFSDGGYEPEPDPDEFDGDDIGSYARMITPPPRRPDIQESDRA